MSRYFNHHLYHLIFFERFEVNEISNVLSVLPFHIQKTFENHFYLIHAINIHSSSLAHDAQAGDHNEYVYILVSNEYLNSSKIKLNTENTSAKKSMLKIYPPWFVC